MWLYIGRKFSTIRKPMANSNLLSTIRSLKNRNYRLFFFGNGLSLIGTWMQSVTVGWLVYKLSNSSYILGVAGALGTLPVMLFSLFGGYVADRANRFRILLITQSFAMVQAFLLAILTLTGIVRVSHILVLSFVLGAINAFDIPARQSFVVNVVEKKEDLPNAIALNSFLVNGTKLIGPSLAGIFIAAVGEGICFLINAISYTAVIAALLMMNVSYTTTNNSNMDRESIVKKLQEGIGYVKNFTPIRTVVLYVAYFSIFGMFYGVLMPVFAKEIFHGDARTLGFLVSSGGVGAIIGAIYLASRPVHKGLGKLIHTAGIFFGIALILFSYCRNLWVGLVLLVIVGTCMVLQLVTANIILQTLVPDEKRGRVMSFHTLAFTGTQPISSYIAGVLGNAIGVQKASLIGGILCIAGSIVFRKQYLSFLKNLQKTEQYNLINRIFIG